MKNYMSIFRIIYYACIPGFFIAGILTGVRELFIIFFVLLFVLLYAAFINFWTVLSFSYIQELSESRLVKGNRFNLKLGVYNDKPFPFTMMRIKVELIRQDGGVTLGFNLSPNSSITYDIPVDCPYRGVYKVGMTKLEVNDVFGLFRLDFDMRYLPYYRMKEVVIYPRLVELPYLPSKARDSKLISGEMLRLSDEGDSFADLRGYHAGDSPKRIHWKLSARKRELFVKTYEMPTETGSVIAIDTGNDVYTGEDALFYTDLACECAVAISKHNLNMARSVRVINTNDLYVAKGETEADFQALYEHIATLPFEGKSSPAERIMLELTGNRGMRVLYVITPEITPELGRALASAAGRGCTTVCLFLCDDESRPMDSSLIPGTRCVRVRFGDDIAALLGEVL